MAQWPMATQIWNAAVHCHVSVLLPTMTFPPPPLQTHTDDDTGDEGGMTKATKQVRTKKPRCVHPHLCCSQPINDLRTTHRRISAMKAADNTAKGDPEDFTTYVPLHLCFNPDTNQKKAQRSYNMPHYVTSVNHHNHHHVTGVHDNDHCQYQQLP